MSPYDAQQLSILLKAVADPKRQQIMFLLRHNGECSVGEIARQVQATQPATSQHLRVLKEADILLSRKSGLQMYYRLCSERLYDSVVALVKIYQEEKQPQNGGALNDSSAR